METLLNKFGYAFQMKVLISLMTDNDFTQRVSDVLSPSYFDSEAKQWIVETIFKHFTEYKVPPNLETFKIKLDQEKIDGVLKQTIVDALRDANKHVGSPDLEYVKDETVEFCKNQCIKKAVIESVDLLEQGAYDKIKLIIDNAMKAGADKNVGHEYKEMIDARYLSSVREVRATPWPVINDLVEGGFGKGELIVFVSTAGTGKSWSLINIGAHAVKNGLRVAHYTLELNDAYVGLRYDAVITGISNQNLKYNIDDIKEKISKLSGDLTIKYYPTKTASVLTIKSHIDKLILQNKKPDIVIVDYADLLRNVTAKKEVRHDLENIYEDLRGMAGEYQIPCFTASQAGRGALDDDVIEAGRISESYAKIMIADFVLSLQRKVTDKLAGTGRWHVIKNRFGPDGLTFPSKLNMSNGQINIYEESSVQGISTKKDMNNGTELLRQKISQKYREISGNNFG